MIKRIKFLFLGLRLSKELKNSVRKIKIIPKKNFSVGLIIDSKFDLNDSFIEKLAMNLELSKDRVTGNRNFITKTVKVLIDGAGKHEGQIKGKSEFNQSVALEGEENHIGQIISVQIKDVKMHSLIGERA